MDRLISAASASDPNIQQPLPIGSLLFIEDAQKEAISNYIRGVMGSFYDATKVYVLFGCVKSVGGGNDSFTAGAVFYAGEVYTVPVASFVTGTDYAYILVSNGSPDPITMKDGSSSSVHNVRQIIISGTTASGASQTAIPNYTSWVLCGQWVTITANGTGNSYDFANSWVNGGGAGRTAKFRVTLDGAIEFQGLISGGASAALAFTLPVGYRPSIQVVTGAGCDTASITGARITILTTGTVAPVYAGSGGFVSLEGIKFYL